MGTIINFLVLGMGVRVLTMVGEGISGIGSYKDHYRAQGPIIIP